MQWCCAVRKLLIIVAVLAAAAVEAKPIRVGYLPDIGFSPLNVAQAQGFWKELGVEVALTPYADSASLSKALVEGDLDLAGDLTGNFVGWAMAGAAIKLTAETHTSNGSVKILARGADIQAYKGQAIGVGAEEVGSLFLLARYLNAKGLQLADFKLQESSPAARLAGLRKGQPALAVLPDPQANMARRDYTLLADSATYPGVVTMGFAASKSALASIPDEQWLRFYRGWLKAVNWVRAGNFKWADYRAVLDPKIHAGLLADGDAAAMDMFNSIKFPSNAEAAKRHGQLGGLEYHVRAVLRFMRENGLAKSEPEARNLIQSTTFEKALATR